MGLMRKFTSGISFGTVDFKSDKERIASNTKKTLNAVKKQTKVIEAENFKQRVLEQQEQDRRLRNESSIQTGDTPDSDVNSSRLTQLKKLGDLRDSGVLTAAEFEIEKARILSA